LQLADKNLDKSILKEYLSKLNLNQDILNSDYNELSGGEKQRIALILTFILERDLILLDEPTSALDKTNRDKFILLINEIEATKIIISHDDSINEIANEVLEL
jgi:putative ABC transport system ATP-binding protein